MCNPITIVQAAWSDAPSQAGLRAVRLAVFVHEQEVPEEREWDAFDETALHLLARDPFGHPVGVARMLPDGHIGRVAVVQSWRGKGVGTELMRMMLHEARRRGLEEVHLDAQVRAIAFYEGLGFTAEGEEFMDAGIPHRHMRLAL